MAEKVMQHSPRTILRHPIIGGGVAGIFAGIIEYVLSSGTSGLVPAVAAGVTTLILFIWDRTLTPKQEKEPHTGHAIDSKHDEEDGSKAQPESPLPVEGERLFSRRTPEELIALVKGQTGLTASDLTKPHIGTWLRIEGPIYNIDPPSHSTITVVMDLSGGFSDLLVFLSFDETHWRDRLRILDIGDSITAIGKIHQIDNAGISLEECELIGH